MDSGFGASLWELLLSTLRVSAPLVFAAMAGLLSERSGVVHLALEGFLLVGAFSAGAAAALTHSPWIGALVGMGATAIFALLYGILTVKLRSDQIVAGTAMNLLAFGLVPLVCKSLFDVTGGTPALELSDRFTYEPLVVMIALVIAIHFWLNQFRAGLRLTVVGEKPEAAMAAGVSVTAVRLKAIVVGGLIAGFGGASLSLYLSSSYSKNMTAGRGFMALAALIFGKWRPLPTLLACLFFAFTDALQIRLQGASFAGVTIPVQFVQILPYAVTVFVLAGFVGKSRAPSSLGKPFVASLGFLMFTLFGLSGCELPRFSFLEGNKPVPVASTPIPTPSVAVTNGPLIQSELTREQKERYFAEMRAVIFGAHAPEKLDAEDTGMFFAWLSGASLEGVYHGMILGKRYRRLEGKAPAAEPALLAKFCGLLSGSENCAETHARKSAFELRRILGEKVIRSVNEIFSRARAEKSNANAVKDLSGLFARFGGSGVDFGTPSRNKATPETQAEWLRTIFATRGPALAADQILWELLNRSLRLVPVPAKN